MTSSDYDSIALNSLTGCVSKAKFHSGMPCRRAELKYLFARQYMSLKSHNPIHGQKKLGLLSRKWLVELIVGGPPLILAAVAAFRFYDDPKSQVLFYASLVGCGWLVAAYIVKVVHAMQEGHAEQESRSHDGLTAALHVLHSTVSYVGGLADQEKFKALRVTFHRVVPPIRKSEEIEQIVPYVGGNGAGQWRRFPIRSGLTGMTIRTKNGPLVMDRRGASLESYKQELIQKYGYTDADLDKITSDRESFMCVPVKDRSGANVLGVIYLDTSVPGLFAKQDVYDAVLSACAGISRYTGDRYE